MFQTFSSFFLIQNKHLPKFLNGRKSGPQRDLEKTASDDTRMFCICKLHTTALKMSISSLIFNYESCLNKKLKEKAMSSLPLKNKPTKEKNKKQKNKQTNPQTYKIKKFWIKSPKGSSVVLRSNKEAQDGYT